MFCSTDGCNPFSKLPLNNRIVVVNCETVLFENSADAEPSGWKLINIAKNVSEVVIESIRSCDVFCLANNHTLDQGVQGLRHTAKWIENQGKIAIGTNNKTHTAHLVNGKWVAIYSMAAMAGHKYRQFPNSKLALIEIPDLKFKFDYVVVTVHWGREYADYPSPAQRKLAAKLIKSGADMIIGHHPHVFQGMEIIHGRPVYYSLGNANFATWQNRYSQWSTFSLVVACDFNSGKPRLTEYFYKIDDSANMEVLSEKKEQMCRDRYFSISGDKLKNNWLQWGMKTSEIFVEQETDALRERFCRGTFSVLIVLIYWLSRPMTLFLLFTYGIKKTLILFFRK